MHPTNAAVTPAALMTIKICADTTTGTGFPDVH